MNKPRILVVDDHKPLLEAIRANLEEENFAVLTATNGVQALKVMEETRPDLIVADIMMPQMDGYAFYKEVRARPEWVTIPFLFLTAKADRDDILKGKALGAEDYLTKPFDHRELLVAIQARLSRARAIQEATEAELDELKSQIVNVLGHELRTPLTYVTGYAELALEDIPSLTPTELEQFLGGIKQGADRLGKLVDDLLLLIRLDMGRVEAEFELLARIHWQPGAVIKRTVESYRKPAESAGVGLELRIPPSLPPVRLCEPLFADALGRLVDNSIKFTQDRGKTVTISTRTREGHLEIDVSDRGVGIPPEETKRLFRRFQQIERDKLEQQGAGLGLYIAHQLIQLHGGEIEVESEPEMGSTFTIYLPIAE